MKSLYQNTWLVCTLFLVAFICFYQLPDAWVNHDVTSHNDYSFYMLFFLVFFELGFLLSYKSQKNKSIAHFYFLFMNFFMVLYFIYLFLRPVP